MDEKDKAMNEMRREISALKARLQSLEDAETIEAIPVEWIESQVDKGKWRELVQRWQERKCSGRQQNDNRK